MSHRARKISGAGIGVLTGALCLYLLIGTVIAIQLTTPPQQVRLLDSAQGPALEAVSLNARDGVRLAGWTLPSAGSNRGVLMVHGLNSCSLCEFDGKFVNLARELNTAGYNVLMIDLRGHGQSSAARVTMGDGERWDVLGGADWLRAHGSAQVAVLGISLGAVSTVRAGLEPDGAQAIRAMVLDSCFADFGDVLDHSFTQDTGIPSAVLPGALLMEKLLFNIDLAQVRPIDQLPRLRAPLLLMYGSADRYVRLELEQAMMSAVPAAQTWLAPDAAHAHIYTRYHDEYLARVTRFLQTAMP